MTAPGGAPVRRPAVVDRGRVEASVRELLTALGQDPDRPGLRDTPRRVADAWEDLLGVHDASVAPVPFPADGGDGTVVVREIGFVSVCEHHLLPFAGVVHVAYDPAAVLLGLSDLPRLVRRAAAGLHMQEALTGEIADRVEEAAAPVGLLVVVDARHGCVSDRGVRESGARATTVAARGTFEAAERAAGALALMGAPAGLRPGDAGPGGTGR